MEQRESRYLKIFQEISKTISTTLAVEQRLKVMAEGIVKAMEVKGSTIRLLDDTGKELKLVASYGLSPGYFDKGAVTADKSITDAMAGKTVVIKDARTIHGFNTLSRSRKRGLFRCSPSPSSSGKRSWVS